MSTTVLSGGRILTMDKTHPVAEVMVVNGGRIVAVGDLDLTDRYPDASIVDLTGKTVVPGFIDAHAHLCIEAMHPRWADLSQVTEASQLGPALVAQAEAEPETEWVRGVGWSDLANGFTPTRRDLDELGIDRPVIVVHYSYHQCVVSSAGLDALGISESTPDPRGGAFGRLRSGALNGLLVERAFSEAHARSMHSYRDPDRWPDNLVVAARKLLADGITCVHDAACPPWAEDMYGRLAREERLPISVVTMPHADALLGPLDIERLEGPVTGEGNERLRVGPIKLFADGGVMPGIEGSLQGREISFGVVFEGLEDQVAAVVDRGFRVAVHAIGNRGVEAALGAFEAASRRSDEDHRFRVEHATLLSDGQPKRMAELGAIGVVQPGFVHHMGGAVDGFELDKAAWMPFGDLARADVTIAASSDSPCTFNQPLLTSARGVTRCTSKNTTIGAEQALSYETWLRAYTAGAAYAGGQENERGMIIPGLRADMVVLEGELDAERPPRVAETWVAGDRVFKS
ncbi:MAG TPA: amidohydrolase [Acidimicrobiales bacterium]|nr:amidohydrolase [Acidimicrobiales bacterium]